jgi:hypothetical protein
VLHGAAQRGNAPHGMARHLGAPPDAASHGASASHAASPDDSWHARVFNGLSSGLSAVASAASRLGCSVVAAVGGALCLSSTSSRERTSPAAARRDVPALHGPAPLGDALHDTALHSTAPHGDALHGAAQHPAAPRTASLGGLRHGTGSLHAALHGMAQHGTALHGTWRHGTALLSMAPGGTASHGAASDPSSSSSRERASSEPARRDVPASCARACRILDEDPCGGTGASSSSLSRADFDNSAG